MYISKVLKKGIKFLTDKNYRFLLKSSLGFYNDLSDEDFLQKIYRVSIGKELDLKNPCSFNEKLQWLKLYDRNQKYTDMVDKYEVKKYISEVIGEEYVIPTLGVWNSFDEINFDKLPNQFVLKCTHDSGGLVICKDKRNLDLKRAKKKLDKSLKHNFYYYGREWPYKNITPRIIAEQYISAGSNTGLNDYKMMCFNGKFKCCFLCFDRDSNGKAKIIIYDDKWNNMEFGRKKVYYQDFKKPKTWDKMIELSEKLAENIPFVRVDFYDVNGRLYFGELTFFPGSGLEGFTPEEWDYKLGKWLELPIEKKNGV